MIAQCATLVVCGAITILSLASPVQAEGNKTPPAGMLRQIKVVADRAPDCSSLKSIAQSVTRDCKTNDEKAIAIYNFMQLAYYHRAYPEEPGGTAALKAINVYGWSLCGGLHAAQSALWRELGWKWRFLGWPGHTTVEAFYDGQWHYLDVFLKIYAWKNDPKAPSGRTIASEADIASNPDLILKNLVMDESRGVMFARDNTPQTNWMAMPFLVCGDDAPGVVTGCQKRSDRGSPTGWGVIKFDNDGYTTDVNLGPGGSLTLTWDKIDGAWYWYKQKEAPIHGCPPSPDSIDKDYRNSPSNGPILEPYITSGGNKRSYANGTLVFAPDFRNDAFLAGLADQENVRLADGRLMPAQAGKPAWIVVELQSPYVMTKASGTADGIDKAEISEDGKTFQPIDLKDFSQAVRGQYQAFVRLTFGKPVKSLRLEAVVQCNRCALPYLSPGRNKITVSAMNPKDLGDSRLAVTYAYRLGWHDKSFEQIVKEGGRVGAAQSATWTDSPTVVQKIFAAKDLPATFEIDVPTPKGKHPAYPRMVFLRREVLAPGSKPIALPDNARPAELGPTDELQTLPNPFLVGTTWPGTDRTEAAR